MGALQGVRKIWKIGKLGSRSKSRRMQTPYSVITPENNLFYVHALIKYLMFVINNFNVGFTSNYIRQEQPVGGVFERSAEKFWRSDEMMA